MQIITEPDFLNVDKAHRWAEQFQILNYSQGGLSTIPHGFFRNWLDQKENISGKFYIGKCSGFGIDSIVKYDAGLQSLPRWQICGRWFAIEIFIEWST
jgi:hypothetical protein